MLLVDNLLMGEDYLDASSILNNAMRLALMAAPALVATIAESSAQVQLALPLLAGHGGLDNVDTGSPEVLLRCFAKFTQTIHQVIHKETLQPLAVWHKAEVQQEGGYDWYSKACRADREAVVLLDPSKSSSKSKRLYIYIGHGQLTAGSSDLVTGLVMKAKDWQVAVSACVAIAVLTACCPGRPVLVSEDLCIIGGALHGLRR